MEVRSSNSIKKMLYLFRGNQIVAENINFGTIFECFELNKRE